MNDFGVFFVPERQMWKAEIFGRVKYFYTPGDAWKYVAIGLAKEIRNLKGQDSPVIVEDTDA